MKKINPSLTRCCLSGIMHWWGVMVAGLCGSWLVDIIFGDMPTILVGGLMLAVAGVAVFGSIVGILTKDRVIISVYESVLIQHETKIAISTAKLKETRFGLLVNGGKKKRIKCTSWQFPPSEIEKLKQILNANQCMEAIVTTPVDSVDIKSTQPHLKRSLRELNETTRLHF